MNHLRFLCSMFLALTFFISCEKEKTNFTGTAKVNFSVDTLREVENADAPITIYVGMNNFEHAGGTISIEITGATHGIDYLTNEGGRSFDLVVEPGSLVTSFSIIPLDDKVIGQGKELEIKITGVEGSLELGSKTSISYSIIDNDNPLIATVGFKSDSYELLENDNASTQVELSFDKNSTNGGSIMIDGVGEAVFGTDYSIEGVESLPFELIVPAGASSASFSISPIDNMKFASDKTVELTLTESTGAIQIGQPNTSMITLINDDASLNPVIDFSVASLGISEDSGAVTINFKLSEAAYEDTIVEITASGDAVLGSDYTFDSNMDNPYIVTIPAGATTASFIVSVIDDMDVEPIENIILDITDVRGGLALGVSNVQQTIMISDNDAVAGFSYQETFETITDLSEIGYEVITVNQDAGIPDGALLKHHKKADSYADVNDVNSSSDNGIQIFHKIDNGGGLVDNMLITKSLEATGDLNLSVDVAYVTGLAKNNAEVTLYWSDTYSGSATFADAEWNALETITAAGLDAEGVQRNAFSRRDHTISPTAVFYIGIRVIQNIDATNDAVQWRFDNIQVNN